MRLYEAVQHVQHDGYAPTAPESVPRRPPYNRPMAIATTTATRRSSGSRCTPSCAPSRRCSAAARHGSGRASRTSRTPHLPGLPGHARHPAGHQPSARWSWSMPHRARARLPDPDRPPSASSARTTSTRTCRRATRSASTPCRCARTVAWRCRSPRKRRGQHRHHPGAPGGGHRPAAAWRPRLQPGRLQSGRECR